VKAPFDFGVGYVLRLIAPSAILAAALFPIGLILREIAYPTLGDTPTFAVLALVAGFALLLLDMPIYMLLEGRRYWPAGLRNWGIARQARRLARMRQRAEPAAAPAAPSAAPSAPSAAPAARVEYQLQTAQFPTDRASGEPRAIYPTRLGNLLASYETYPTVKYGIDGVFFWPRLWVAIDKDLREELDSAQALVDGAVYTCVAFAVAAMLSFVYAAALGPAIAWAAAGGVSALLSFACYRAVLPRYVQYGELFSATFDQHRSKLELSFLLDALDAHMNDIRPAKRSDREAALATWRFLRWHRYRRSGAGKNEIVRNWLP
jgi:hypothetical protein